MDETVNGTARVATEQPRMRYTYLVLRIPTY